VIANLALYFALHTLFADTSRVSFGPLGLEVPRLPSLQVPALVVTVLGFVLVFALRWSVLRTLAVCAFAGIALHLLTAALP
jgi:chromate transporter